MFCPSCGTKTGDDDAFCPMCGGDLRGVAAAPPAQPPVEEPAPATVAPPAPPAPPPPVAPPQATTPMPPAAAPLPQPGYAPPAAAVPAPATGSSAMYAKAGVGARLVAAIVDGIIASPLLPVGLLLVYAGAATGKASILGFVLVGVGAIWQLGYSLARDGVRGAGFGKRMVGLVVTQSATGAPAGMGASIVRQLVMYALNLIPGIGSLIEPILVLTDKDGRRLGDKAAKTQVARASDVAARGFAVPGGKAVAIVMLIVTLLVGIAGAGIGGFAFAKALQEATGADFVIDDTGGDVSGDVADQVSVSGEPQATVDAFYAGLANGDIDAVRATMVADFAAEIEAGYFEGWTSPSYSVISVESNGSDLATVELQEYDGGLCNGLVAFSLAVEDGAWKITGWEIGGSDFDTGAEEPGGGALNPETALDAVGTMLVALQQDDIEGMKAVATKSMQADYPDYFYPSSGAFIDFEVVDVFLDVDVYVVQVTEDWNSGPENVTYIVVDEGGTAKVDAVMWE